MQDVIWLAVAFSFFLLSGRLVAFADRLMPSATRQPDGTAERTGVQG